MPAAEVIEDYESHSLLRGDIQRSTEGALDAAHHRTPMKRKHD